MVVNVSTLGPEIWDCLNPEETAEVAFFRRP